MGSRSKTPEGVEILLILGSVVPTQDYPRQPTCGSDLSLQTLTISASIIPFCLFQKFRVDMPGSGSAFIPTINAITTSQDLQWMVQPTVITSMSNPYPRSHPYSPLPGLASVPGHMALPRPGVIKTIGTTVGRRRRDEQVQLRPAERSHVNVGTCGAL